MQRQLRCTDYTVGWVCALPVELAAAQLMLDAKHPDLPRDPSDNHGNLYVFGSINGHNVVIGCLPAGQTGNNSAAVVATQMLATFKKIRFGLMVGIGGGVPSTHSDIRLGDVVVSQPAGTFGGVVQYDMGKTTSDGFLRTGSLNSPPQTLLNALAAIQADEWLGKSGFLAHAQKLEGTKFRRSRAGQDVLFHAAYEHEDPHSQTCVKCSADRIETRQPRMDGEEVVVHFGTVASGNRVMKNATERDIASAQLGGVLCFEMEAAGLMNTFPCLVIRGICDYSDTHKNDRWQAYAAGIAAAYAREVVSVIQPTEVADIQTADSEVSQRSDPQPAQHRHTFQPNATAVDHVSAARPPSQPSQIARNHETRQSLNHETTPEKLELSDDQRKVIKASLHFKQRDARLLTLKQAQAKTCQWLLKNAKYADWIHADKITEHRGFFWIKGKPGSGKSIMMKFLFSHAKRSMKKSIVLSFFFNARGESLEKTTSGLYRALVLQLLEKAPQTWAAFELDEIGATLNLIEESGWQEEVLRQLFIRCLQRLGDHRVVCFVDALDECPEDDIRAMVSFFEEIGEIESTAEFRVCFSSRHYPEINIRTGLQLVLEDEAEHKNDITLYIDANLRIDHVSQFEDVRAEILRKASGIFLWVHLVIPVLNKEYDTGRIKALKKRLTEIPDNLNDLFVDMLTRDQRRVRFLRITIEIILHAARPLKPEEFRIAIESYFDPSYGHDQCYDAESLSAENLRKFVLDASKGLAEITKSKEPTVQWIHESVRDFFLTENGLNKLRSTENGCQVSGHSIFVKLCLQQLDSVIQNNKFRSEGVERERSFITYAVDYVLYHANNAQRTNRDQSSFLSQFENHYRRGWCSLYCTDRGDSLSNAHLLYILSEFGADELIRLHPERSRHLDLSEGGHYGLPLLAALYAGHNAAARALFDLPPALDDCSSTTLQSRQRPTFALKKDKFKHELQIWTILCEYGDPDLLECVLIEENEERNFVPSHQLYPYAVSEAIVDTIVSFQRISGDDPYTFTRRRPMTSANPDDASIDLPYLRLLLKDHPDIINSTSIWAVSGGLLSYAAAKGFHRIARLCIETTDAHNWRMALLSAMRSAVNQESRTLILKQLFEVGLDSLPDKVSVEQELFETICLPHNECIVEQVLEKMNPNLDATFHRGERIPTLFNPKATLDRTEGMTLLLWALYQGRKTYVKMLLDAGSDPMARDPYDGTTALMLAIKLGDLSSFRLLLHHPKHEPNARDNSGGTALSWCAKVADGFACAMIAELTVQGGIRPNLTDKSGRTALA
ncbi:hypothetical protein C7974DRAFT_377081 [Boeremia exigua]|uniref:uncharacterized protein n=1 Tax=Boeremia exigua TaxID=749465 RepID=UPI001E8CA960|nr:uncharacterized protein C7974DRAFT_377081 [Boeremia exigua]KAH6625586.1 hypothetical protein C7974DRAFT_377081 [Boeremia exigua]